MNSQAQSDLTSRIIKKARAFGASLAGITSVDAIRNSPSYEVYGQVEKPSETGSLLVLALAHKTSEPQLDWWDHSKEGGSPGDRRLMSLANSLIQWLREELNVNARTLPYFIEKGGVFLKDAAVLAGLGCIGRNNLLITPEFGPRIRFRALFIDENLENTGPLDYGPCEACDMPCRGACPREAFKDGSYGKTSCYMQMNADVDESKKGALETSREGDSPDTHISYCRACELACVVAG